jgi:RNA polymerase sigma-70 factor (ECF subfamily)
MIGVDQDGERSEWKALSDEDVVRRVLAGDGALFEVLMRRYNQRLYRVARAILRNDGEAEDVMQQAYVEAYSHLDQFEGRAKFSTWLTKIAVYEALARVRRRARTTAATPPRSMDEGEEEDPMSRIRSQGPDPEQQASQGELRTLLESAILALPATYRSVVVLRDLEGMSTAETAECLSLREDAVKTRLHRARALLREELYERAGVTAPMAFSFHLTRCSRVVAAVFARLNLGAPLQAH